MPQNRDIAAYLERMEFFDRIGRPVPRSIQAHDAADRFYVLSAVSRATLPGGTTHQISADIAQVLSPNDPDMRGVLFYCVTELMNNVMQHSGAVGSTAAQYYPQNDEVELAIADTGIGIRDGLCENPTLRNKIGSDLDALILAKKPAVSGKAYPQGPYFDLQNAGLGLFMLSRITALTVGYMYLWSGNAFLFQDGNLSDKPVPTNPFTGTAVAVRLKRNMVYSIAEMMKEIREEIQDAEGKDS